MVRLARHKSWWPLAAMILSATARATIYGGIENVGFPSVRGIAMGQDLFRRGEWMPVRIRLTLENEESFDGWLRISQPDKDGDLVYDVQPVHLRRDQTRMYWLYTPAGRTTGQADSFAVELLSEKNERVQLVCRGEQTRTLAPAMPPVTLSSHDFLVLSVGPTVGRVAQLRDSPRPVPVAHFSPGALPPLWQGLQSVNAIVWDRADPTELSDAQLEALLEWTRQGGVLVIAAGATSDVVASRLGNVLPVDIGPTQSTTSLPRFHDRMLNIRDQSIARYARPIVVAACTAKADATVILAERGPDVDTALVTERRLGDGTVVFVAAALADLLEGDGDHAGFLKRILRLRDVPHSRAYFETSSLAAEIDGWIGFKQIGATYLVAAVILAGVYIFVSTFGAWQFLRTRGWLHHSWTVFALAGLSASVVTVVGVQAVRGVGKSLQQLTIVDVDSGSSSARATAYFGLKTSLFGSLDVWLPNDFPQVTEPAPSPCVLQPMPPNSVAASALYYAAPGRYQAVPSRAELLGVPIRGTLKQFEGRWAGTMPGKMRAELRVVAGGPGGKYDWRITPDSVIVNELGVDLHAAFLVYAAQNIYVDDSTIEVPGRADKVYMFALGPLAAGQSIKPADQMYLDNVGGELDFEEWSKNTLLAAVESWSKDLSGYYLGDLSRRSSAWMGLERHELALLLLSMFGEYQPKEDVRGWGMGRPESFLAAGSCRHLDISGLVDTRTALFIGLARSPGPVTLCSRGNGDEEYRRVSPSDALTMYRVLIPLR